MKPDEVKSKLKGNIVPVPAQYHSDLSINHAGLKEHVEFLVDQNIKCFYLAMSASEFDYMTGDERVAVTGAAAYGSVPGHLKRRHTCRDMTTRI